jgi:hypothetical protein
MVGGIGGGGGPPGPGKLGGVGGAGAPAAPATEGAKGPKGASFQEVLGPRESGAASASSPLDRLRAGEIDRARYVELRVQEATAHLDGLLPPEELARIQDELRDLVEQDPDVAALVRAAEIGS